MLCIISHRLNPATVTFRPSFTLQPRRLAARGFIFVLLFQHNPSSAQHCLGWLWCTFFKPGKDTTDHASVSWCWAPMPPGSCHLPKLLHTGASRKLLQAPSAEPATTPCLHLEIGAWVPVTNYQAILPTKARTAANFRKSAVLATGDLS